MGKVIKVGAGLAGGGAIIGGGIAVDRYLLEGSLEEESTISILPASIPSTVQVEDEGETMDSALRKEGFTLASTDDEFQTIYQEIKREGVFNWADGVSKNYGIKNSNYKDMQNRCKQELKRKYSEFKGHPKSAEFKAIKLFCTTNYTLTDNAKDYLNEGEYIGSKDQELDNSKWSQKIEAFKGKNANKGVEEMKDKCLSIGKALYRSYRQNTSANEFYEYCVLR